MANTITSANAVFLLGIGALYPTSQNIQQFGVDDAFTTDLTDAAESQVGVDGYGVSGYIPRSPQMTIRLLASSPSCDIFDNWLAAEDAAQDILYGNAVITLTSLKLKYTCYRGTLMRVSTLADARKVLQNREFHIQWLPQGPIPAITRSPQ